MAQRTLNSAFWDDEDVAKLGFAERLLFACMFTDDSLSDDWGCLPANPRTLRKHAFGYDDHVTVDQVREWLANIVATCRNVLPYTANGQDYLYLRNFAKWQGLKYHRKSNIPRPPAGLVKGQAEPQAPEELPEEPSELESEASEANSENLRKIPEEVQEIGASSSTSRVESSRVVLSSVGLDRKSVV